MHLDVEIPTDLAPLVTQGNGAWADCFATIRETESACRSVGFEIVEAGYAPDARLWWEEYAEYDPGCRTGLDGDRMAIQSSLPWQPLPWLAVGMSHTHPPPLARPA